MRNRKFFQFLAVSALAAVFSVSGFATSYQLGSGTLTAVVAQVAGGGVFYDVRGSASIDVQGTGFSDSVGLATPDPNAAFGNNVLFAYQLSPLEYGVLSFDFTTPNFVGSTLYLKALATPLSPLTNPALIALLTESPLTFGFEYSTSSTVGDALFHVFNLTSIEGTQPSGVPEPGSFALVGCGAAFAVFRLRRKFSN